MKQQALDQLLDHHAQAQAQLLKLGPDGERYFGAYEKALDLSFADLRGLSLAGRTLRNIDLRGADLRGASFEGADLEHVVMRMARLDHAQFSNASLTYAGLQDVAAEAVSFKGATIAHSFLKMAQFKGGDFDDATLENSTMHECRVVGSTFNRARIRNATLRDTAFRNCRLNDAEFERINAAGSRFINCEFVDSTLAQFGVKFRVEEKKQALGVRPVAKFRDCTFVRTQFEGCDLSNVQAATSTFDVCALVGSTPFADFKPEWSGIMVLRDAPTNAAIDDVALEKSLHDVGRTQLKNAAVRSFSL